MTAVAEAQQPGVEAVSSPQSAVVGIIAGEGAHQSFRTIAIGRVAGEEKEPRQNTDHHAVARG